MSSQLKLNILSGPIATFINIVALAASYPVYIHYLGYEIYGVWLVLSTIIAFTQLSNLGLAPAVIKLVAENSSYDKTEIVEKYLINCIVLLLVSCSVVMLILYIFSNSIVSLFNLSAQNSELIHKYLPVMVILSFYVLIVQLITATLSGLGRMDISNYIESFGRLISLSCSIILLYIGYGMVSLLIGNLISYIFIHALSHYCVNKINKYSFTNIGNISIDTMLVPLKYGLGLMGSSVISMLLTPFNRLVVSKYLGVAMVPVYDIAFNSSMQIRGVLDSANKSLSPEISRLRSSNAASDIQSIRRLLEKSLKIVFSIGLPVCIVLFFLSPYLLKIWLGSRYLNVIASCFQLMLLGIFFGAIGTPAYYLLLGLGHTNKILIANIIQSGVNVIAIVAFVLCLGVFNIELVITATVLGMVTANLYLLKTTSASITRLSDV